jgi:adenosine deaminase
MKLDDDQPARLADLHIHVGGAVAPHILWAIAHDRGFKLPVRNFWEFKELISARPGKITSLGEYLEVMHKWTEKIQSSPQAIERAVYEIICKEYRSGVGLIELRFNPMKRNESGSRDLDHIIYAAIRGMEKAKIEYDVKAGLIFCMAREFSLKHNRIIVEKAVKYKSRGVIGIDLAGIEHDPMETYNDKLMAEYGDLCAYARNSGLGVTIHTGETKKTGAEGIKNIIEVLNPNRIGHGILAYKSPDVCALIKERNIVLELCPSSNLATHAVEDINELSRAVKTFLIKGVKFTINTDGPYMLDTNLNDEFKLLWDNKILDINDRNKAEAQAWESSFIT